VHVIISGRRLTLSPPFECAVERKVEKAREQKARRARRRDGRPELVTPVA